MCACDIDLTVIKTVSDLPMLVLPPTSLASIGNHVNSHAIL